MDFSDDNHEAVCQKHIQAAILTRLQAPAEAEALEGRARSIREFLYEFKRDRAIQG